MLVTRRHFCLVEDFPCFLFAPWGKCVCCSCFHICSMYFAYLKRRHAELFAVLCSSLGGKVSNEANSWDILSNFRILQVWGQLIHQVRSKHRRGGLKLSPPQKTTRRGRKDLSVALKNHPTIRLGTPRQQRYFVKPNDFHPTAWARIWSRWMTCSLESSPWFLRSRMLHGEETNGKGGHFWHSWRGGMGTSQ